MGMFEYIRMTTPGATPVILDFDPVFSVCTTPCGGGGGIYKKYKFKS